MELLSEQDAVWADGAARRLLALLRSRPESDWVMFTTFMLASARLLGREDEIAKQQKGRTDERVEQPA